MKIHYISCHSILEYDEVQMFLDMGHEVFSNGAYLDPAGHISLPRPGLKGGRYYTAWVDLAKNYPRTALPDELIEPFDVIIVMHSPEIIIQNWDKLKHKKVIWRSIGQSLSNIERKLAPMRAEGLKIVRYSPKEENIADYIGSDAMIRFAKDPNVYQGWTGNTENVINFSQTLKGRRQFCHYDEIFPVIEKYDGIVYGSGNEDLGKFNGGQIPFEKMLDVMRESRVMVYAGTWPAPYTLAFIEALMMGLPLVCVSKAIAHLQNHEEVDFYEVDEIMAKISAPVCDTTEQMIQAVQNYIDHPGLAQMISERQRALAIEMFGVETISKQWQEFLQSL